MYIGWIKLHRILLDWEWYTDVYTAHLFMHLLLVANTEDKAWMGIEVKRGELITSLNHLVRETGVSKDRVRTILKRLERTGEIVKETHNKFTKITVVNYNQYQEKHPQKASVKCQKAVRKMSISNQQNNPNFP